MGYLADCMEVLGFVWEHDDAVNNPTAGAKLETSWFKSQVSPFGILCGGSGPNPVSE